MGTYISCTNGKSFFSTFFVGCFIAIFNIVVAKNCRILPGIWFIYIILYGICQGLIVCLLKNI